MAYYLSINDFYLVKLLPFNFFKHWLFLGNMLRSQKLLKINTFFIQRATLKCNMSIALVFSHLSNSIQWIRDSVFNCIAKIHF